MSDRPLGPTQAMILDLCARRGASKTICPSEVARALDPDGWRDLVPEVRHAALGLALEGRLRVSQKGRPVDPARAQGPIRLGLPGSSSGGLETPVARA